MKNKNKVDSNGNRPSGKIRTVLAVGAIAGSLLTEKKQAPADAKVAPKRPNSKHRVRRALGTVTALATFAGGGITTGLKIGEAIKSRDNQIAALEAKQKIQDETSQALSEQLGAEKQLAEQSNRELQRVATIMANLSGLKPNLLRGTNLLEIKDLPGYDTQVSPETRRELELATIKLGRRSKGSTDAWEQWCTGVKVQDAAGTPLISTAGHCLSEKDRGVIPDTKGLGRPLAFNITDSTPFEYAVLDPQEPPDLRSTSAPLATITSIAVDTSGNADMALLKPLSSGYTNSAGRNFEQLPAISLSRLSRVDNPPLPGEEAALYGIPAINNNLPVVDTGRYIGRLTTYEPGRLNTTMDFIAINATRLDQVACTYGASGSQAAYADGKVSSSLSLKITKGVGSDGRVELPSEDKKYNQQYILYLEDNLGVRLDDYNTFCGFAVPQTDATQTDTISNLTRVLNDPNDLPYYESQGKGGEEISAMSISK